MILSVPRSVPRIERFAVRDSATLSGAITVAASLVLAEDPDAMHKQVLTPKWHTHVMHATPRAFAAGGFMTMAQS
jgi:hypothetical protein